MLAEAGLLSEIVRIFEIRLESGRPELMEQRSRTDRSTTNSAVEYIRQRPIMLHEAGHDVLREIQMG